MRRLVVAGAVLLALAGPAAAHEPESNAWSPLTGGPRLGVGAADVLRTLPADSSPGLDALRAFPLGPAKLRALGRGRAGGRAVRHRAGARTTASVRAGSAHVERASTETGAGEPTMAVAADGTLFYVGFGGFQQSLPLRSRDGGATWERLDPGIAGEDTDETSFDPFIWLDKRTGRLWDADLTAPACATISYSDDNGKTFQFGSNCLHADHQNLFAGPPPDGGAAPTGHPHVVYYCSQEGGATLASAATSCSRSLDGGSTWARTLTPAYTPDPSRTGGSFGIQGFCSGAVGHGVAGPDGTVFLPRGWCDQPFLAISRDEGDTWERVQVASLGMMVGIEDEVLISGATLAVEDHEASVAVDEAGTVYYFWIARDHLPYLAVSRDAGKTFAKPLMVAPPGVNEAWGPSIDVGDNGRIALTYIGTTTSPGGPYCVRTTSTTTCETEGGGAPRASSEYENTTWNGYMAVSVNADSPAPVFETAMVNDPSDPLMRGGGCGPVRCLAQLDFLDVVVARDGTAWGSFVDACDGADACGSSGTGIVGHLVGGPPLVGALADQRPAVVAPPSTPAARCVPGRVVRIRVKPPRRGRVRSVRATVNGKRVRVSVGRRGRRSVAVDLARFRGRTVRVVVTVRTSTGRSVRSTRRYSVCP